MLASIRKVFILLVIITLLAFIGVFLYNRGRTYFNEEEETGNTAGNIFNGGLFCEQDGKIYFSNHNDNGALYVMNSDCTNIKKVISDKAVNINADENYLYYLRASDTKASIAGSLMQFNNSGLYRITHGGKNLKIISHKPGAYMTLQGNFLYYLSYDVESGLCLFRKKIDNTMEKLILDEAVIPSYIADNKLYYAGNKKDHSINALDLSSFVTGTRIEGNFACPIFREDYIYYLDLDNNYSLNRMRLDGSERTVLIDKFCSTYNITNSGKYLYYQVDDEDNSGIGRLNLETMEHELLLEGYYKQIHVTDSYVFFKDYDDSRTYVLSADGSSRLGIFDPPNLSEKK
jgi:hypothetical protein